ncbi:MAG: alpha/beta hydrolase [Candidatus Dormibacteraeota bacterium]|nr:alpha/beta hydrolase [Candidatus Dormibacteraeota bacterium]
MESLADDRRVIFYDMRNRGRSDEVRDPGQLGFEHEINDLEAVREHFHLEQMALVGWSYLGAVTALYSARHPQRVSRLLLVGPMTLRRKPLPAEIRAMVDKRIDAAGVKHLEDMRNSGLDKSDPVAYCREYTRVHRPRQLADRSALSRIKSDPCELPNEWPSNVNKNFERLYASIGEWNWQHDVASVSAPTLVIYGAEDLATAEDMRDWPAAIANARLFLIRGAGHFPWAEAPEKFFPATQQFLDGTWPAEAENFSA